MNTVRIELCPKSQQLAAADRLGYSWGTGHNITTKLILLERLLSLGEPGTTR
jgi:hypothetical protein